MPELPEVQTIVDDLNRKIKGDIITDFWSDWEKAIKGKSIEQFKKEIKNRKILGARRIGKNIFIDLSGGKTLYIHLKMTGHLLVKKKEVRSKNKAAGKDYFSDRVNQYIHHVWKLKMQSVSWRTKRKTNENFDKTLEFSDLRKFGKIVLDDTNKINNLKEIKSLGIDAMSLAFTYQKFSDILMRRKKSPIGLVLMDQNLISGIGNIYRSEILFCAKILPTRKIADISEREKKSSYDFIKKILKKAIKYRGTSDSDYRDTSGVPGNYQKVILVYRRNGQKCKRCGTIIKRSKMGQRSFFFCPKCQS